METAQVVSLALSVIALATTVYIAGYRLGRLEQKIDVLWEFVIRRAKVESVIRGWADMNSPLVFTPEAKTVLSIIQSRLLDYYREINGRKMADLDLFIAIEKKFGDELIEKVCIPYQMYSGSCILAAIAVCREEDSVNTLS